MFVIREKNNPKKILRSGFTLRMGELGEYDSSIYEEVELNELPQGWEQVKEKPLAMGTDLIRFINERTEAALDDLTAFGIVSKLKDFMIYCQQGRCNPFTQKTFNTILQTLDAVFQNVEKKLIIDLTQEWAKSVKFKHEPTEDDKGTDKPEPPPLEVQQLVKGSCPTPQTLDKRGRKYGKRAASVKG